MGDCLRDAYNQPCVHAKAVYTVKRWHLRRGLGITIEKHIKRCKCGYKRVTWSLVHEKQ